MKRYQRMSLHDAAMDLVTEMVKIREIDDSEASRSGIIYMRLECKGAQYLVHVTASLGICKEVTE